jgi:hypothetical protein
MCVGCAVIASDLRHTDPIALPEGRAWMPGAWLRLLVRSLAYHSPPQLRSWAIRRLIAAGPDAVAPLVAELLAETSTVDWRYAGDVLRKIGRPAFDALAAAIATAPSEDARLQCGWAFVGFGPDLVQGYAAALEHPSPHVRRDAALGIQYLKAAGLPAVPALLPLLADPDEGVRQRAVWAFGEIGELAIPALRQVRASGPGRLRAGALRALAEIAGEDGLRPEDRAAVDRLIGIKLLTETAQPVDGCNMCGSWLALPTGDQAAIVEALDLSRPRRATLRLGFAAFYCDSHGLAPDGQRLGRVFITPQLDGWSLVLGAWYARWQDVHAPWQPHSRQYEAAAACELSTRFGSAQAYWYDAQTMQSAWLICTDGEIRRWYDPEEPAAGVGARLPVEEGVRLPDEDWQPNVPEMCDALTVGAALSVSPAALGVHTVLRGHGLLALTRYGREHGVPAGELPI